MFFLYYSGGVLNASPALSVGGAKSLVAVNRRLFGPLTTQQFQTGVTLYRCVYVLTSEEAVILPWIASDTPSPNTTVAIGWGAAEVNETEPAILTEAGTVTDTAPPPDVVFSTAASAEAAVSGGQFGAGDYRALWIRYTLNPTDPIPFEAFTLTLDTAVGIDAGEFDLSQPGNSQYLGFF